MVTGGRAINPKTLKSMFLNYGKLLAFFELKNIQVINIGPKKWKKYYNLGRDKKESVELARNLFPNHVKKLLISKDGRAESALIGYYGFIT